MAASLRWRPPEVRGLFAEVQELLYFSEAEMTSAGRERSERPHGDLTGRAKRGAPVLQRHERRLYLLKSITNRTGILAVTDTVCLRSPN